MAKIIEMKGVRKKYRLGQYNVTTLQHELQSWWAAKRGSEDPNGRIGQKISNEEFYALDGIDLEVEAGQSLGIIGRNGAGKSTLLKLLARVTAPSEGTIDLYGRVTSMLEVGAGFSGELTGRENIYINGAILGMSKAEVDARMDEIIAFSELERFIDTPVKRYSSGMYTKLGFAVAITLDSEIIIMDEVLAVGDAAFQNKCIARMKEAASRQGRTVLYVSHNMEQIRKLCDRCIVIDKGRIIFDGEPEKAIGCYLDNALNDDAFYDYRNYRRPVWLHDERMRLLEASYLQGNGTVSDDDRYLNLSLKIECYEDLEAIGLRLEVWSVNEQRLGTYVLYDMCDGKAGQIIDLDLEVDVSAFKENSYRVIYCFFNSDELGGNVNLDRVEGLSFTKTDRRDRYELVWDHQEWGPMELKGARVKAVRKQKT